MDRAREQVDLGAAVVDVVLAGHPPAELREQVGERVAEHRAAAVADVERPGRIGRAELDIDASAAAEIGCPIAAAGIEDDPDLRSPEVVGEAQVDEAWLGDLDRRHLGQLQQAGRQRLGDRERRPAGGLGQDQGGVGRGVAVGEVARRLDRDPVGRQPFRQLARCLAGRDRGQDVALQLLERIHRQGVTARACRLNRRSCASSAKRSVMPAM